MTQEQQSKIIMLLLNSRGDDLERAEIAFGKLSDEELDQVYGQSEQTRRQILTRYREQRSEFNGLILALRELRA